MLIRHLTCATWAAALLLSSGVVSAQQPTAPLPPPPPPGAAYAPQPGVQGAQPGPYAQQPGPYANGGYAPMGEPLTVTVTLESTEPGVKIALYRRGAKVDESKPIMSCVDLCTGQVRPGAYMFAVTENDDVVGGTRNVEIDGNVHLLIDPDM